MTQESLTEKLAAHLIRPVDRNMRDALHKRARLHLLDWMGCVAGARQSKIANIVKMAESDILTRAAMLGNVLEMDDIHRTSILHPGPAVWPSALSAIREVNGTMEILLNGAAVGYEAMIIIGETLDSRHYEFYHNSATAGGFGAAVAAGHIFGFDKDKYVFAMGNAGSIAGGLWQMRHENVMTKQMHLTHAALAGLWQARLARQGFTGPKFILEGPQGLYAATCDKPKPMKYLDEWRIFDVSFKPWGACRHAHPAIDAAIRLKERRGDLHGEIVVETYKDAVTFCDRQNPQSTQEAKFSIQHALAVIADKGEIELNDFEPDAISKYAAARARITVEQADDIEARYPQHYGARVSCGGDVVEVIDALGDPECPMSEGQIMDKARQLILWGGLSEKDADAAINLCLNSNDVGEIQKLLQGWLS
ncbi:hypothetical protein LPB140_01025 [Sphingorhabdus lutea]|uniref:MmgE/PrpD family protein n=1 Tax=Sphingorhabdus lutea TaxID=1913578 RepID=A0A1L3J952_9SPHN|nr:MmgE/PrpD family protein [Sphingorhabdus lutea]APG61654.1 hypothetical protein LPB140_01025 [Sphingorhabdus lutea]